MHLTEKFISASVNPRSHCLTACRSKPLVIYASALQIAVQTIPEDETKVGVIKSLSERRHQKPITVLKRLKSPENIDELVSGGVDSNVVLWKLREERVEYVTNLSGCVGSIGSVCGCVEEDRKVVAAAWVSESANGFQAWWTSYEGDLVHSAKIELDHKAFALCLDAISFSNSVLLAVGTSKRFVELFGESEDRKSFSRLISVAGHTDWIHSIAFNDNFSNLLVASAGQDTYVRLWSIQPDGKEPTKDSEDVTEELTSSANLFSLHGSAFRCSSYAVMQGHDDWVHSTTWSRDGQVLLTASSDKTCIIWRELDDLWRDDVRLGIVGGQAAGFFSAVFLESSSESAPSAVVSSSYFGGLHAWKSSDEQKTFWTALPMTGGHVGEVRDVDWQKSANSPDSSFLVSVGQDQTTRVFAKNQEDVYLEMARPQVHGHDMQCISLVTPSVFVSGAEEKVFRAFRAPKSFVKSLEAITGISSEKSFGIAEIAEFGACVPALGLSNKPMAEGETVDGEHWEEDAFRAAPTILTHAVTEDTLQQNTLWPEEHKLYGHGYEVYAVTANPSGKVLATACKSSHVEHSILILWNTSDWAKKSQVIGHQLTVTQIAWNPSGTSILTVSRDRTAKIYKEKSGNVDGFDYSCVWTSGKEHSRIIWACDWLDDQRFVTAARDQKVIIWKEGADGQAIPLHTIKLDEPVTAVAATTDHVVAGLQSGELVVLAVEEEGLKMVQSMGKNPIPIDAAILRLRFSQSKKRLAVASADAKLRVFDFSQ